MKLKSHQLYSPSLFKFDDNAFGREPGRNTRFMSDCLFNGVSIMMECNGWIYALSTSLRKPYQY